MPDNQAPASAALFNKLAADNDLRKKITDALDLVGGPPEAAVQALAKFVTAGLEWDAAVKAAAVWMREPMPGGPIRCAAAVRGGGSVSKSSDGGEFERVTALDLQASIASMSEDQKADLAIRLSQQIRRISQ